MVETLADIPQPTDSAAEVQTPSNTQAPARRVALRGQLALTVCAALAAGFLLGRIDTGYWLGKAAAGLGILVCLAAGIRLSWAAIARPILTFADQLDALAVDHRRTQIRELPTDRDDEVGRMAVAVRTLVIDRIRDHQDARQLRRTLDDRINRATRKAVSNLSKLAMRDALTDLGNRRFLDANLPTLVQTAKDSGTDLLCLTLDLDNFKKVNDTRGHAKGDELLALLADLIKTSIRHHDDLAIRLGGDEFVVFMPGATLDRAAELFDHVRQLFRQQAAVVLGADMNINVSVGAASLQKENCRDGEELMERADEYLYQAKRSGKGITWTMHGRAAA